MIPKPREANAREVELQANARLQGFIISDHRK